MTDDEAAAFRRVLNGPPSRIECHPLPSRKDYTLRVFGNAFIRATVFRFTFLRGSAQYLWQYVVTWLEMESAVSIDSLIEEIFERFERARRLET